MLLRFQVSWEVLLCCLISSFEVPKACNAFIFRIKQSKNHQNCIKLQNLPFQVAKSQMIYDSLLLPELSRACCFQTLPLDISPNVGVRDNITATNKIRILLQSLNFNITLPPQRKSALILSPNNEQH